MSLAALQAWAKDHGKPLEVEEMARLVDRVHVRITSEVDGRPGYMEQIVPVDQATAVTETMAADMLDYLRDEQRHQSR